jgi:hypothetical protein
MRRCSCICQAPPAARHWPAFRNSPRPGQGIWSPQVAASRRGTRASSPSHLVSSGLISPEPAVCLGSETNMAPTGWSRKRCLDLHLVGSPGVGSWRDTWADGKRARAELAARWLRFSANKRHSCPSLTRAAGMETCFGGPCDGANHCWMGFFEAHILIWVGAPPTGNQLAALLRATRSTMSRCASAP